MAWQVGPVQDTADGQGNFAGSGFNIVDATTKRPLVTFRYLKPDDAKHAHKLIAEALKEAKFVGTHP
jgi:hypothetical protein